MINLKKWGPLLAVLLGIVSLIGGVATAVDKVVVQPQIAPLRAKVEGHEEQLKRQDRLNEKLVDKLEQIGKDVAEINGRLKAKGF